MSGLGERFGEVGQADEKQLRLLMQDWRHGRADRNIWQALGDAYVMVFGVDELQGVPADHLRRVDTQERL